MNKKLNGLFLLLCFGGIAYGQNNTSYGLGAGTGGYSNSFFGYYSGHNATGGANTAVGTRALELNTIGDHNVAIGIYALRENTTGLNNTGVGAYALRDNTSGQFNVGLGYESLNNNTGGSANVALGASSMKNNTTGNYNTAVGYESLYLNTTGNNNTATGYSTLFYNSTGHSNVSLGYRSMVFNTTGYRNTAVGTEALVTNTTGHNNTAVGHHSMLDNTTGRYNTANGAYALEKNSTGAYNTALGYSASKENTTGNRNTAIGFNALHGTTTGQYNTAVGFRALVNNVSGTGNTVLGYQAGGSASYLYSTALGSYTINTASYQVRVGHFGVTSIGGYQNWTNLSDGRFKKDVQEDVLGLDFINALRPVSYYVDQNAVGDFLGVEADDEVLLAANKKQYQTGFIAQEVEATAKELGFKHFNGVEAPENEKSHYGLRYAEFVVPLVKSVQELSQQNKVLSTTVEDLKQLVWQQQQQINALLEQQATGTPPSKTSSTKAQLYQNQPNPFGEDTEIKVFIPQEAKQARLQVCSLDGKQVFMQEINERDATSIHFSKGKLEAGIYWYSLVVDNQIVATKQMILTQ